MNAHAPDLCLKEQHAVDFVLGRLRPKEVVHVEEHMEHCGDCRLLLLELAKASSANLATLGTAPEFEDSETTPLRIGATVGRYLITETLGAGSMGVVYCAYDPKLHRRLAIKFLRHKGAGGSLGTQRLLREAQALARLAHPSVVSVHDVGTEDGQVFLAMEFCSGGTLQEWLATETPSQAEVLARFLAAGEGLAAAHAQGLVHRDFKPANVLLTTDGHAKVTDFGLAFSETSASPVQENIELDAAITQTGALVGTPAYMAPEQLRGEQSGQASDQFSFCVALWEGLSGTRPFAGASIPTLLVSIKEQTFAETSESIPAKLRAILTKGLRESPDERHTSMASLLSELAHVARPRRRAAAVGALLAAVVAGSAVVYAWPSNEASACTGSERHLAQSWSAERQLAIQEAFQRSGLPGAEQQWKRVSESMNRYATSWTLAHRQSCEATKVYGEQSTDTLDLRMGCLRRLDNDFASLSELYANANTEIVARSLAMVGELQDSSLCADMPYLEARGKLPADPETRKRIEVVERALASVEALESAGSYKEAMSNANALVRQATDLGHKATLAEVLFVRGRIAGRLGELDAATNDLGDALLAAEASAHQALRVEISLELGRTTGTRGAKVEAGMQLAKQAYAIAEGQGRQPQWIGEALLLQAQLWQAKGNYEKAEGLLAEARAIVEASPQGLPLLRASLAMFRGKLSYAHGKLAEAETYYEQARVGMEETLGAAHPLVANVLVNLGTLAKDRRDFEKALVLYEEAKERFAQSLGPEHVRVAQVLGNIALVHTEAGPLEQALEEHLQSLKILQRELGDNHQSVGLQLNNVGLALTYLRRGEEAIPYFEKTKEVFAAIDENHALISLADSNLGLAYRSLNKLELARKHYTLALDRLVASHGNSNPDVASRLSDLAIIAIIREEYDEAVPLLTRAIAAFRESDSPPSYIATNLLDLGWVQVQRGQVEAAKQILAEADRTYEEMQSTDYYRHGSAKFELAKLLWASPSERTRAHDLAVAALQLYERVGEKMAEEAGEIKAWLRTHKAPKA